MDGALGSNTFEKQDKVLVGLNGGMDAAVTVRILQEQGFAVQAALVHFAGMADDAVETAQNAAKALDVTLHGIEAADTAADELLKFQLLMQTADKLDCRFISTGHYARVEQDADECRLCAPEHALDNKHLSDTYSMQAHCHHYMRSGGYLLFLSESDSLLLLHLRST